MIGFESAKKKAEAYAEPLGIGEALDDGEYFIFSYTKDVDVSPVGVHKESGEVIDYFPPEHPKFVDAKEVMNDVL